MTTHSQIPLLLEAVYAQQQSNPDKIYLTQPVGGGQTIDYSWAKVLDQARRMAGHLRSLNLPPKSNVAVMSKNCAHFIMTDLAVWMAGHVTVALYPTLDAGTVEYILKHSEAKLLFVGKLDTWDDMKVGVPKDLPRIAYPLAPPNDYPQWDDIVDKTEPISDKPKRKADELAIIIYTSGSTGRPKGVMQSFGAMSASAHNMVKKLKILPSDRGLSYLPLSHAMERGVIQCTSFYSGCRLYFAESQDTFLQDLQRARPTIFLSVPRLWLKFQLGVFQKMPEKKLNLLLKIPILSGLLGKKILTGLGLEAVRLAGSGSAPIPAELISWYRKLGLVILEGYGMTEDFNYSHLSTPELGKPGYVGVPLPDVEVRIGDNKEIQVKSPGRMMGYYKEPEMTAECYTEDGFFKTGDQGERLENGLLRIIGRVKELFKTSKGKYVAPVPIENLINGDSLIEVSCVSGLGRPQPYAQVMLGEDQRKNLSDEQRRREIAQGLEKLLETVNNQLATYERLQFIVVVKDEWLIENGFLTPTMKIKRNVIEEAYAPFVDQWYQSGQKVLWQA